MTNKFEKYSTLLQISEWPCGCEIYYPSQPLKGILIRSPEDTILIILSLIKMLRIQNPKYLEHYSWKIVSEIFKKDKK